MNDKENMFPESMEEIISDPATFGFPTFEQFAANPDAFRKKDDELLATVDKGSNILTKGVRKYEYRICGYNAKTLEEVQAIAFNEGKNFLNMEISSQIIPDVAGNFTILVTFKDKL